MSKTLSSIVLVALVAISVPAQLTLTNFANGNVSSSTTVGTCHSIDTGVTAIGAGSCLRGAGSSNSCYLPTGLALDPTTSGICAGLGTNNDGFTIQFWYLPANAGAFAYTFGDATWVGAAGAFRCFQNGAAGAGNLILRGPLTQVATVGAPLTATPGQWIHFAVVVDNVTNMIEWYVNGVLNNSGAANITGSGTNLTIMGYNGSSAAGSDGNYDDYRVYQHARTAADVMQDYNDGLAGLDAFSQAAVSPSGCFTLPDGVYYPCEIPQNAHNGTVTRNTEPGTAETRLFTAGDSISWGCSSPAAGPFQASALINVFFGAGASPRTEGFQDPTAIPGGPYTTTIGATTYGGIEMGHCLSTPGTTAALNFMWPDTLSFGALGVTPCGGTAVPSSYMYGAGLTPADPAFTVPPGLFNTGDRIDIQYFSPDATFAAAGGIGTANRCVLEYVTPITGEHAHIEARGVSSLQVSTFWEIHNTGDVPIQQVCIDLSTAATTAAWEPAGAINSGGTLATLDTFRKSTDLICDLDTTNGPTVDNNNVTVFATGQTGVNLCLDFACPPSAAGGFEGPTDHFMFDCDINPAVNGAGLIGATVTVTYCNGVVQTGTMVSDPADPMAAILDL